MAIEIEIGADNKDLERKIAEAEILIKNLRKDMAAEFKLGNIDAAEKIQAEVNLAKQSLKGLQSEMAKTSVATQNFGKSTANGGQALMQFSRIAQDAPFGIMGIGNNITATAESFSHLSKQAGGTGAALKAVASSLMGTGGILLAVSLVTTALTYMSQKGLSVGDVFDMLIGKGRDLEKVNLNKAFESDKVVEATKNVSDLTNEIKLAKEGFINKEGVVKHYNETIGKTTGLVTDLDGVEKALVKNGDAYIKMTLLKAAANLASQDAAKQALEAERSRQKKLTEFASSFESTKLNGQGFGGTGSFNASEYEKDKKRSLDAQKKRRQEEVKVNEDAAKANLSIAAKFNADAAKIAKDFNFNFFQDTKNGGGGAKNKRPDISSVLGFEKFDPSKYETFAKKQLDLLYGSMGNALKTFQTTPIPVNIPIQPTISGLTYISEELMRFNEDVNNLVSTSISDTFSNLGDAIGNALSTGGNVLQAVGQSLLQSLGGFLSEMGGLLIKYGTLAVLKGKLDLAILTGGPVSIGAGLAAIAVGIALKAAGGAIGQAANAGAKGGSRASSSTGGNSYSSGGYSGGYSGGSGGGTVVFEIAGQKLIGVLSNTLNGNSRLGGAVNIG